MRQTGLLGVRRGGWVVLQALAYRVFRSSLAQCLAAWNLTSSSLIQKRLALHRTGTPVQHAQPGIAVWLSTMCQDRFLLRRQKDLRISTCFWIHAMTQPVFRSRADLHRRRRWNLNGSGSLGCLQEEIQSWQLWSRRAGCEHGMEQSWKRCIPKFSSGGSFPVPACGERFSTGSPGVYLHKDSTKHKAEHYIRFVQLPSLQFSCSQMGSADPSQLSSHSGKTNGSVGATD